MTKSSQTSPDHEYQSGPLRGLTPNVMKLGLVSMVADIASEMLYPILPLFLSTVLGAPAVAIGLIEGLAEATASVLKLFSGAITDRTQTRKPWVGTGYFFSGIGKAGIGLASGWGWVLACRVMDRFGKGIRTSPRDALLSDSVRPQHQGKAFGWHRGMDTLGAAIGPLIALALLEIFNHDLRKVFFVSIIPASLALMFVLWIREAPAKKHHAQDFPKWKLSHMPRNFWKLMAVMTVFGVCNSSDIFLILRFQKIENSMTALILTYCGYNLIYALASPYLGGLADKVGLRKVFTAGFFIFSIVYFTFANSQSLLGLIFGFALYGLYMATTEGVSKALAISMVPAHLKGTALGIFGLLVGFSSLIASIFAGWLWDHISPAAVFYYGAGGSALAALLFFITRPSSASSYAGQS